MRYRSPRRTSKRHLSIVSEHGVCQCQIVNFSRTGVALRGLPPGRQGSPLILRTHGGDMAATLIWQRDDITGVQLVHALSDDESLIFQSLGGQMTEPDAALDQALPGGFRGGSPDPMPR